MRASWRIHTYQELVDELNSGTDPGLVLHMLIEKLQETMPEKDQKGEQSNGLKEKS